MLYPCPDARLLAIPTNPGSSPGLKGSGEKLDRASPTPRRTTRARPTTRSATLRLRLHTEAKSTPELIGGLVGGPWGGCLESAIAGVAIIATPRRGGAG